MHSKPPSPSAAAGIARVPGPDTAAAAATAGGGGCIASSINTIPEVQERLYYKGIKPGGAARKQGVTGVTRSLGDTQGHYQQQSSYYLQKYQQQQTGWSGASCQPSKPQQQVAAMNASLRVRSTSKSPDTGVYDTSATRGVPGDVNSGSCVEVLLGSISNSGDTSSNSRFDGFGRLKALASPFGAPAVQFGCWWNESWGRSVRQGKMWQQQLQQVPKQQLQGRVKEAWEGGAWGKEVEGVGVVKWVAGAPVVRLVKQHVVVVLLQVMMCAW